MVLKNGSVIYEHFLEYNDEGRVVHEKEYSKTKKLIFGSSLKNTKTEKSPKSFVTVDYNPSTKIM